MPGDAMGVVGTSTRGSEADLSPPGFVAETWIATSEAASAIQNPPPRRRRFAAHAFAASEAIAVERHTDTSTPVNQQGMEIKPVMTWRIIPKKT